MCTGKILEITRGLTPQRLILLKQQTAIHQHQQALANATSTQTQAAAIVQQKLSLPTGIEQIRAPGASAASVIPRFPGLSTNSGSTVKGLTGGRTRHVEDVLKQRSLRMAAKTSVTQAGSAATIVQVPNTKVQEQTGSKLITTPGTISSDGKNQMKTAAQTPKHDKV